MTNEKDSSSTGSTSARTLRRGLQLLELVAASTDGARVSDLAASSGIDRGTVSRLLATLREAGYVRQRTTDRRYSLSSKLTRLSQSYLAQIDLRTVAQPHLSALRDEVGETIHLAIREGNRISYIDQFEPDRSVRHSSAVGQTLPMYLTAMGRAVLAALSPPERQQLLTHLPTEHRYDGFIHDKERLTEELDLAAERGWATVDRGDDVTRIAAAILDGLDEPIGAISISGPTYRIGATIDELGQRCVDTAAQIAGDYNL